MERAILDQKANPNTKDSYGYTPLSEAVSTKWDKNKELVELLLKKEADPNMVVGFKKETPLYIACQTPGCESFNIEIIELLLKKGADVNQVVDDRKNTVLHTLVSDSFGISDETPILKKQLPGLIELLIKCGANIYAQNSGGYTPESDIENQLRSYRVNDKKFVTSIQGFLEKQKDSTEYHKKLLELVDKNEDLELLVSIIGGNGLISTRGIQVCSKVIPQILGISGVKLAVKGTIVEGEIEREFSQGPVIEIKGNPLIKYYDLFDKIIAAFPGNHVISKLSHIRFYSQPKELMSILVTVKQKLCNLFANPEEMLDEGFLDNLKREFCNLKSTKNKLNDNLSITVPDLHTLVPDLCTFIGMLEIAVKERTFQRNDTELNNEFVPIKQKLCDSIEQLRKNEQEVEKQKEKDLRCKVCCYIRDNLRIIKQELWDEPRAPTETKKEEGNVTKQHVAQKEPGKGTVKQHGKKKTGGDSDSKEKREEATSEKTVMGHPTVNSGVYSHKEAKEPPIFSRKQKIAISVGIVAALATALVCYSVQLPILAIVVSALIVGAGASMISSKLYEAVVCDGTSPQPGF